MDEVAFLGCVILPVYGLAMLGDAIIFNSVEFWTGDNPMETVQMEGDGKTVEMALQEDGSILVSDGQRAFVLERTETGVIAKDADGHVLYRSMKNTDGRGFPKLPGTARVNRHTPIKQPPGPLLQTAPEVFFLKKSC